MTRIVTSDSMGHSVPEVLHRMTDGGLGRPMSVCFELLATAKDIDPQNDWGGMGAMVSLDILGIYGYFIWVLYKDVCGEDQTNLQAVLRGWQLGFLTKKQIVHAINHCGYGLDVASILAQVKERLPEFGRSEVKRKE